MCNCKPKKVGKSVRAFSKEGDVPLSNRLNAYAVINAGNTTLIVDAQWPLQPGQTLGFGGNENEEIDAPLYIQFELPTPAPPTPVNRAVVMQKFYIDER